MSRTILVIGKVLTTHYFPFHLGSSGGGLGPRRRANDTAAYKTDVDCFALSMRFRDPIPLKARVNVTL